jgi:hypothetical protein
MGSSQHEQVPPKPRRRMKVLQFGAVLGAEQFRITGLAPLD